MKPLSSMTKSDFLDNAATANRSEYGTFFPEHFPSSSQETDHLVDNHQENDDQRHQLSSNYQRYRYYNRLFNSGSMEGDKQSLLVIPDHVIPWYFILPKVTVANFSVSQSDPGRKQSSLVTIFAIWNMMMGTSILCLPWAFHRAGLIGGLIIILTMTALCFFTASLVIRVPLILDIQINEFTDLCRLLLGPVAHKISQVSSLSVLAGGCIVYWVLMTNFLRHIISFVYQIEFLNMTIGLNASDVVCNPVTNISAITDEPYARFMTTLNYAVPCILVSILGPITCLKSVSFFFRFNIIGTFSVFYLMAFAAFKAYHLGLVHVSFDEPGSPSYVPLFDWNFPVYTGVLSLAMFIHNCLTTLLKTQKNPENNRRDLAIAYSLVCGTYLFITTLIYVSFPLAKDCIKDNFLDNYESNDLYAFITRLFLLLQVLALFPLLVYMLRTQVLQIFEDKEGDDEPSSSNSINSTNRAPKFNFVRVLVMNSILLVVCILFAAFYPQIGTIIRYCGSFSGMILIFILPTLTFIKARSIVGQSIENPFWLFCLALVIVFGVFNFFTQFFVKT